MAQILVWVLLVTSISSKVFAIQSFDVGTSLMPHGRDLMVGGYDHINETIWILGMMFPTSSRPQTALWSFTINKWNRSDAFTNYGENSIPAYVYTYGQSYTQQNNILYIINRQGSDASFHHFDLSTQTFTPKWNNMTIPVAITTEACLTDINNHLIISAGNTVQIYQIAGHTWLDNIPLMLHSRLGHACNAYNDEYIYQIGGFDSIWGYHNSVEKLYVGDMTNIANQQWIMLHDKLSKAAVYMASVIYNNQIYVIGGYHGEWHGSTETKGFQIIDAIHVLTDRIISRLQLAIAVYKSLPIIVKDKIFVFGGDTSVGAMTNHFQYYDIPPPTPYPTNEPSENPTITTINPTHSPSDVTINPTKFPTITPTTSYPTTSEPTKHPTLKPTTNPTVRPSTSPTLKPTVFGECGFAQISGFKYPLDHCFATKYSSTSMSYKYSCTSGILYYNIYQSNLDCSAPATSIIDYSSSVDEFSCSPYKCRNYVEYTYWYNDKCTHDSDFILSGYVIDQCLYNSYSNKYQKVTCSQDSLAVTTYIDTQCIQEYHYTPSPNIVPTPPPISVCLEINHCESVVSNPTALPTKMKQAAPSNYPSTTQTAVPSVVSFTSQPTASVLSPSSDIPLISSTVSPLLTSIPAPSFATIDTTIINIGESTSLVTESTLNKKVVVSNLSLNSILIVIIGALIFVLCVCGVYVYYLREKRGKQFENGLKNYVEENQIEMEIEGATEDKYKPKQSKKVNTAAITLLENA